MLFSELYGTYFQTVAFILTAAVDHVLQPGEMERIIQENAFGESMLNIPEALGKEHWRLMRDDGRSIIRNAPTMPLTTLQKRWINAIAYDPRIRLFTDEPVVFPDIEPLFLPEDIKVFDRYGDGDPYENGRIYSQFPFDSGCNETSISASDQC